MLKLLEITNANFVNKPELQFCLRCTPNVTQETGFLL